jgi:hypothetical protein
MAIVNGIASILQAIIGGIAAFFGQFSAYFPLIEHA